VTDQTEKGICRRQEHPRPRTRHAAEAAAALARRDQGSPVWHPGLRRPAAIQAIRSRRRSGTGDERPPAIRRCHGAVKTSLASCVGCPTIPSTALSWTKPSNSCLPAISPGS